MTYYEQPCDTNCLGCSYCSDAYGVDAIKDANLELGNSPYDREGYYAARRWGWTRGPTYPDKKGEE